MNPIDYAILAKRAYADAPTVGRADSASRMHVYGDVHVFRGSDDIESWMADFDIATVHVEGLGELHCGFWHALAAILPACMSIQRPSAIVGHSLGAAMAIAYAGVWALRGIAIPVYAFEPPRMCGDDTLANLLQAKKVPWFATRNGHDLVTEVPVGLSLPGPLTQIGHPAEPFDNPIDHSMDRVIQALAA